MTRFRWRDLLFGWPMAFWLFAAGLWLVVLQPLGAGFGWMPGHLGDARLNNYILEHFFRWLTGREASYWTAPFFHPYPFTLAFSENLLGSAPAYAALRLAGLDMMGAFQGWFVLGYAANFAAAAYVLRRLGFHPWAVGAGPFFFTFGLPMLAKENHAQLLYRFAIPLACYSLWRVVHESDPRKLIDLLFWIVCQFTLSIYMGFFLALLAGALTVVLAALELRARPVRETAASIGDGLRAAWRGMSAPGRCGSVAAVLLLAAGLLALLAPYVYVSSRYGFARTAQDVGVYLPRPESYLLADDSQIWSWLGERVPGPPARAEHQLFPGLAVLAAIAIGLGARFRTRQARLAQAGLAAVLLLVGLTLSVKGWSLYLPLASLPGVDSIRAVGRIMLALAWPLAVYLAWVVDSVLAYYDTRPAAARLFACLTIALLMSESVFYDHETFPKAAARARLDQLRARLPVTVPPQPVLFAASGGEEPAWATELDAMLLAQQLGWPTFNGYSGNTPPGYEPAKACRRLPRRIQAYMEFSGQADEAAYIDLMNRTVLIGFEDCDPAWWSRMP